jgi:hypothetical protein
MFSSETIADIHRLVTEKRHEDVLEATALRTQSLRAEYPKSKAPASILETARTDEARFGDAASFVGSAMFDFDHVVVNSNVYRRTLASARRYRQRPDEKQGMKGLSLEDAESVMELRDDGDSAG